MIYLHFFFFSSRRRHTRFDCDWSSDVCSSDLPRSFMRKNSTSTAGKRRRTRIMTAPTGQRRLATIDKTAKTKSAGKLRSEERRVGKECRSRWSAYHGKQKIHNDVSVKTEVKIV